MRSTVCHLIDPASPGGGACTLRLLANVQAHLPSFTHAGLVLGTGRHVALAHRCGVTSVHQVPMPQSEPALARRALRRWIDSYETVNGPFALLHAWGPGAALLAILAAPHHKRIATFSIGPTSALETQRLSRALQLHPMPILTDSVAVASEYQTAGLDGACCAVISPGVDPNSTMINSREELRRAWEVDDQTFVIGLFAEPPDWTDAKTAMEAIARSVMTGRRVRLLLHHTSRHRPLAEKRFRKLFDDAVLIVDDRAAEPWRVMSGIDAALVISSERNGERNVKKSKGQKINRVRYVLRHFRIVDLLTGGGRRLQPMPGTGPLLHAMAAGVPVVAEAGGAVRDIIEDGVSGFLFEPGDINAASNRLVQLHDDRTLARNIGDAGQRHAQQAFHISRFCDRLEKAYRMEMGSVQTAELG